MGLFDFIKKQFIDVIQWTDAEDGILVYRYPMQDFEIQNGAQLTVRDAQIALFVNEGQIADQFTAGLYTLNTQTLPVTTNLKNWDKFFASPFKSDVYFFNTARQINRQWGTSNPITLRDAEFGSVRLRAFGIYTYRLQDPVVFYREICGARAVYTADDLDGQLLGLIVSTLSDHIANSGVAFLDLAAHQDQLAQQLQLKLQQAFQKIGLQLEEFLLQNLSLPEELQKVLDQRIGINIAGNLQQLNQFQVAQSIPIAAANEGGVAGAGAGLGAGLAMAQSMMSNLAVPGAAPSQGDVVKEDPLQLLDKLHGLMVKGVISEAEFNAKKADILNKM
ncbi:MAG TPA: SPFH domain-containing protein [Cellvibrio sp.]|nr:SPFH domain-containing protein [Cellvibrio sp.]